MEFKDRFPEITELLGGLKNDQKKVDRKRSLEKIMKLSENKNLSSGDLALLFRYLFKPLLRTFQDPSEKCRELAGQLYTELVGKISFDGWELSLSCLVPVLKLRLTGTNAESSEEVRLVLVRIINQVLEVDHSSVTTFYEDLMHILSVLIVDVNHDVKKLSCEAVLLFRTKLIGPTLRHSFLGLTKPLLEALSHNHLKVRLAGVRAAGHIIVTAKHGQFGQVMTSLKRLSLDPSPKVRLGVGRVAYILLEQCSQNHEIFAPALFFMLTGLEDDDVEVKGELAQRWWALGESWQKNNFERGDLTEEHVPHPGGQPTFDQVPPQCCRQLVNEFFRDIAPMALDSLYDWRAPVRVQGSKVLLGCLKHMENDVEPGLLVTLLDALVSSVEDECTNECIKLSAQLIGRQTDSKTWLSPILKRLHKDPTSAQLRVLSNLLKGTSGEQRSKCIDRVASSLAEDSVCCELGDVYQAELLACVNDLISSLSCCHLEAASSLLYIVIAVLGVSTSEEVKTLGKRQLNMFQEQCDFEDRSEMLNTLLESNLKRLQLASDSWLEPSCTGSCIFAESCTLLSDEAVQVSPRILELVLSICKTVLSNLQHPSSLHVSYMSLLGKFIQHQATSEEFRLSFRRFIPELIEKLVIPGLTYHMGITAGLLRQAAVDCLVVILRLEQCTSLPDALARTLLCVAHDDSARTRSGACKALGLALGCTFSGDISHCLVEEVCPHLQQSLNDRCPAVRREAASATCVLTQTVLGCREHSRDGLMLQQLRPSLLNFQLELMEDVDAEQQLHQQISISLKQMESFGGEFGGNDFQRELTTQLPDVSHLSI